MTVSGRIVKIGRYKKGNTLFVAPQSALLRYAHTLGNVLELLCSHVFPLAFLMHTLLFLAESIHELMSRIK